MEDIFKDIEAAADKVQQEQSIDLGLITQLVNKQQKLERDNDPINVEVLLNVIRGNDMSVADLEEALKTRKKDLFDIRQVQIPEIMKEFGLKSITTTEGTTIQIKGDVSVSVKDPEGFYKFLRDNKAGDLIKKQIIVFLENDEEKKEVVETLNKTSCSFEEKEAVNAQTLKKHVRGMLERGEKIPENLLNVYEYQLSKIKR